MTDNVKMPSMDAAMLTALTPSLEPTGEHRTLPDGYCPDCCGAPCIRTWLGPKRIQRQRTAGWRMPANAVYVGRPTKWGNPWRVVGEYGRGWAVMNQDGPTTTYLGTFRTHERGAY